MDTRFRPIRKGKEAHLTWPAQVILVFEETEGASRYLPTMVSGEQILRPKLADLTLTCAGVPFA